MTGRVAMTRAVVACAVGSALSLLAVTRTWAVQVQIRPAPLGPLHVSRTGGYFVPWLSALALVGLAGTGALLATRGRWRSVVGVIIVLAGLGVLAGSVYGLVAVDGVRPLWPLLCVPAGLLLVGGGALAAARGARWPAMGTRYERRPAGVGPTPPHAAVGSPRPAGRPGAAGPHPAPARPRHDPAAVDDGDPEHPGRHHPEQQGFDPDEYDEVEEEPVSTERSGPSPSEIAMWDALDRGEDPSQ